MSVTKAQLQETAEKLFADIDTNNNGKLEKNEGLAFSKAMMKVLKPEKEPCRRTGVRPRSHRGVRSDERGIYFWGCGSELRQDPSRMCSELRQDT